MTGSHDLPDEARRTSAERVWLHFDTTHLATIALLPEWTLALAAAAQLGTAEQLAVLFQDLERVGLVDHRTVFVPSVADFREVFWLRPHQRPLLGAYLRQRRVKLEDCIQVVKQAVIDTNAAADSEVIARWREALELRRDSSGLKLIEKVDGLVNKGLLADATRMIVAARTLGELVGEPWSEAVTRAQWRLDRAHRAVHDQRLLGNAFVHRHTIEVAVRELLDPDTKQWALHLLGPGGVGKTTLIRYLASGRFSSQHNFGPLVVARADFDELDPRYPEERPAELLLSLVNELTGYGRTRGALRRLRRFYERANRLHEELSRAHRDDRRVASIRRTVAQQFAQFLSDLDGTVLLIIDTCEELNKLYPAGATAPGIHETFKLLEEVHAAAPQVRALLAGRRRLSRSEDGVVEAAGPILDERRFLKVLPVGGYTRDEADTYLRLTKTPIELCPAIIELAGNEVTGYNPFELATYAQWSLVDPRPTPEDLQSGPDYYVQERVLSQLEWKFRPAVSIAVGLRRFDKRLITPALKRLALPVADTFDLLASQEWMNILSLGADGKPLVIEAQEHLRPRLEKATTYQVDLSPLGMDAVAAIADVDLIEVPIETVEAAVRWLPYDKAATWWSGLEQRITRERAWAWASQVTIRVAAAATEGDGPTILAGILATHAAARLHCGHSSDLPTTWQAVIDCLPRYPDPSLREQIGLRARLGLIVCGESDIAELPDLSIAPDDAVIAAADAILATGQSLPFHLARRLNTIGDQFPELVIAAKYLMAGHMLFVPSCRPWRANGDVERALELAVEAADMAGSDSSAVDLGGHPHWIPPRRLDLRCRQAILTIAACTNDDRLTSWANEAWIDGLGALSDVDGDRLASLALDCQMRLGPPQDVGDIDIPYVAHKSAPSWTHRYTRPLVVATAESQWLHGETLAASKRLHEHINAATGTNEDPDTVDACQLALLKLCRYQRSTEYLPSVRTIAEDPDGDPLIRAEAWLVLTLADGERPTTPAEAGGYYAWARCQESNEIIASRVAISETANTPRTQLSATLRYHDILDEPTLDAAAALRPDALAEVMRYWVIDGHDVERRIAQKSKGRQKTELPGLIGRAALEAADVVSVQSAEAAIPLFELALHKLAGIDTQTARRAQLLAQLCRHRASQPVAELDEAVLGSMGGVSLGWELRVKVLRDRRCPARFKSPELAWAHPAQEQIQLLRVLRMIALISPGSRNNPIAIHPYLFLLIQIAYLAMIAFSDWSTMTVAIGAVLWLLSSFTLWSSISRPYPQAIGISLWGHPQGGTFLLTRSHLGLTEVHNGALRNTPSDRKRARVSKVSFARNEPIKLGSVDQIVSAAEGKPSLIQLEVPRDLEGHPWERRIGADTPRWCREDLLFFRREPGRYPTASLYKWLTAARSWPGRGGDDDITMDSRREWPLRRAPIAAIVVGAPVETYAGYRMRVTYAHGLVEQETPDLEQASHPMDLGLQVAYRTGLVILVAEPIDGPAQSLGDQLDGFLALARAALDRNIGGVLIVPPLPDKDAAKLHEIVREHLVRRRLGFLKRSRPHHALRLLSAVKKLAGPDAALDALLIMRTYGPETLPSDRRGHDVSV